MDYTLRRATVNDAEIYAQTHVQALRETYAHLMPAEFHEHYARELPAIVERRRNMLAVEEDAGTRAWVALDKDGAAVGIAASGNGRDDDRPDFELHHIYCLAHTHGSGLGQQLFETAVGPRAAYLWVLNNNPRAERFYQRNGFVPDGERSLCGPTWHYKPMYRMHRPGIEGSDV